MGHLFKKQDEEELKSLTAERRRELFDPVVRRRLRDTIAYFTGGIAGTAFLMAAFAGVNAALFTKYGLGITLLSLWFIVQLIHTDYKQSPVLKSILYAGFVSCTGIGMAPMVKLLGAPLLADAALVTGTTVGSLGLVAWNAPS